MCAISTNLIWPKPFQVKFETPKYGLAAGYHIFYIFYETVGNPCKYRILRLKWVGTRIQEGDSGYLPEDSYDDNWEIIDTFYDDYSYAGESFGYACWSDEHGILYDINFKQYPYYIEYKRWKDYNVYREQIPTEEDLYNDPPSRLYDPMYSYQNHLAVPVQQIFGSIHPSYESVDRKLLVRYKYDEAVKCILLGSLDSCPQKFSTGNAISFTGFPNVVPLIYFSNYFMPVFGYDNYVVETGQMTGLTNRLFQFPNHWSFIGNDADDNYYNSSLLQVFEDSDFDWKHKSTAIGRSYEIAAIKRKSDKSIWKFRQYNATTNTYADLKTVRIKPSGVMDNLQEYAQFSQPGPPIGIGEDWYNLIVVQ